jgi:hypothetical protein
MKDPKLKQAYNRIARKLESFLRSQAPVGRTGTLREQTKVVVDDNGFRIETVNYGFFLHLGTEEETSGLTFEEAIVKRYNPNPGKGDDGIKPRYWMSFGQTLWAQILDEIEREEGIALANMIAAQLGSSMGGAVKVKRK